MKRGHLVICRKKGDYKNNDKLQKEIIKLNCIADSRILKACIFQFLTRFVNFGLIMDKAPVKENLLVILLSGKNCAIISY